MEGHRLSVFENRILERIFGHKMDEKGECKKLHNKELYNFHPVHIRARMIKSGLLR